MRGRRRRGAPSAQPALAGLRGERRPPPPPRLLAQPRRPPAPPAEARRAEPRRRRPPRPQPGADGKRHGPIHSPQRLPARLPPPPCITSGGEQSAGGGVALRRDVQRRARRRTHGEGRGRQKAATSSAHRSGGTGLSGAEPRREGGDRGPGALLTGGKARAWRADKPTCGEGRGEGGLGRWPTPPGFTRWFRPAVGAVPPRPPGGRSAPAPAAPPCGRAAPGKGGGAASAILAPSPAVYGARGAEVGQAPQPPRVHPQGHCLPQPPLCPPTGLPSQCPCLPDGSTGCRNGCGMVQVVWRESCV